MNNKFEVGGWGFVPDELKQKYPRISVSGIMCLSNSPAHYESIYIKEELEESKAMMLGTAIHKAVLEPENFESAYCLEPTAPPEIVQTADDLKDLCKNNGLKVSGTKADLGIRLIEAGISFKLYDDWLVEHLNGRQILSAKEYRACTRIRDRVLESSDMKFLVSGGEAEKLGWALHSRTQTIITFRTDYFKKLQKEIMRCNQVAIDLKSMRNVEQRSFERSVFEMKMYIQAALYTEILDALTGNKTMFAWIAAMQAPPYLVAPYVADFGMIEAGIAKYEQTLDVYRECLEVNKWPYPNSLKTVSLPSWAWNQIEEQANQEAEDATT